MYVLCSENWMTRTKMLLRLPPIRLYLCVRFRIVARFFRVFMSSYDVGLAERSTSCKARGNTSGCGKVLILCVNHAGSSAFCYSRIVTP